VFRFNGSLGVYSAPICGRHPELSEQLVHLPDLANHLRYILPPPLSKADDQANQYLERHLIAI
jgi:hypothetical protein